ncbi:MAG: OmpA family protein [Flammeovirgaceae bacterium]
MKRLFFFWLLIGFTPLFAQQDIPFEKSLFKDRKDGFKAAVKAIKAADDHVEVDQAYHKALELYKKANQFNPNSAALNFKIGSCYLLSPNEPKTEALAYFQKSYQLNPNYNSTIHYYLGRGHQMNGHWDKAIEEYQKYMSKHSNEAPVNDYASVFKRVEECKVGKVLSKKPVRAFIDNLGGVVNSEFPDFGPVINADESLMLFTSRRANTTGGEQDIDYHYFEDIYQSKINAKGEWQTPSNMGDVINSKFHDATVGLSPDGTRMIIFREGDLYECDLIGTEWTKPKKMNKNINTKYVETSASYSFDGSKLYFVSDRPDLTKGGADIFVSERDEDGEWGEPKNLGFTINTTYDEDGVYIHPDGKTMYFSSRGHETIGGYDIFKSVYEDGAWSIPENLGMPINTPDDDVFFVINASGKRGYYSSVKKDGNGEKDIYKVILLGPEKPVFVNTEDILIAGLSQPTRNLVVEQKVVVESNELTLFKGRTLDDENKNAVGAKIEITDNELGEIIAQFTSNNKSGRFLVTLPAGKNYGIAVKAPNYLFHSENFDLPENQGYLEVEKDVFLKKLKPGKKIILRNIFFDTDKSTLRPESKRELENLIALLKENPSLKIEISGHTDTVGADSYNQKLSNDRAKSVVDYLGTKGIAASRLTYKGYGESQPIATNDTPEGRQQNRRTEFKVLK